MKRECRRLSEVQIESSSHCLSPVVAAGDGGQAFTVRLPNGACVTVPAGFDADELFSLLVVMEEAIA